RQNIRSARSSALSTSNARGRPIGAPDFFFFIPGNHTPLLYRKVKKCPRQRSPGVQCLAQPRPSRLRRRFGQPQTNNHSSFGVRRLVAAMARASERKRRQVAALHIGLVICPSFAPIRRQKLTPTSSKCTA